MSRKSYFLMFGSWEKERENILKRRGKMLEEFPYHFYLIRKFRKSALLR